MGLLNRQYFSGVRNLLTKPREFGILPAHFWEDFPRLLAADGRVGELLERAERMHAECWDLLAASGNAPPEGLSIEQPFGGGLPPPAHLSRPGSHLPRPRPLTNHGSRKMRHWEAPINETVLAPRRISLGMGGGGQDLNGIDVVEHLEYVEQVRKDPTVAERNPTIVAKWAGGTRARVERQGVVVHIGGEGDPSAMWMFLASLAVRVVEVVATHASLLGIEIENLDVEAKGHFSIQRLLGLDGPAPGYDRISYTVRLRGKGATEEKVAGLREMCERGSLVEDSLSRKIPIELKVEVA